MLILDSCIQHWHWTMCWVRAIKIDGDVCIALNWHGGIFLLERYFTSGHSGGPFIWRICWAEHDTRQIKNSKIRNDTEIKLNRIEKVEKLISCVTEDSFQWCFAVYSIMLKSQVKDLSVFLEETVFRDVPICALITKIHLDFYFFLNKK